MISWRGIRSKYGSALDVFCGLSSTGALAITYLSGVIPSGWNVCIIFLLALLMMMLVGVRLSEVAQGTKHNIGVLSVLLLCAVILVLFAYSSIYAQVGLFESGSRSVQHDVWTALYFSIVTFTTLGYGDVYPVPADRLIAASEALVGYVILAVAIGAFGRILGFLSKALEEEQ